jgi:hypothetical protein
MKRANLLKTTLLFLTFATLAFSTLVSCGLLTWNECSDYSTYYDDKIHFEEYHGEKRSIDSLRYNMYAFNFSEDSSFSYMRIWHQKYAGDSVIDTVLRLNGKFKIYKDSGMPWFVLKLEADSIYEKEIKDTVAGILNFSAFDASKFEGFGDSLFSNPWFAEKSQDNCFMLYTKYDAKCQRGWAEPCVYKKDGTYWDIQFAKKFCLKQPEETPEQNLTGDSL